MAVQIYDEEHGTKISENGTFTNPVIFKLPLATGGSDEIQLFLRHEHLSGDLVESSYDVQIVPVDEFGTDESQWISLALDNGGLPGTYESPGAPLEIGDVLAGQIIPFWVKIDVPAGQSVGAKEDIQLKLSSTNTAQYYEMPLNLGEFYNCEYNPSLGRIIFDVEKGEGYWQSKWVDVSAYSSINLADYSTTGTIVRVLFRASDDGSEETATEWEQDLKDVPQLGYLQARVEFAANSLVGTEGLVHRMYGNVDFSVYRASDYDIPFSELPAGNYGSPKSAKWTGFFHAPESGEYLFRTVSNDGHRFYLNNDLMADRWESTDTAISSTSRAVLSEGWHSVEWHYFNVDETGTLDDIKVYVTAPNAAERPVVFSDFSPTEMVLSLNSLRFRYMGPRSFLYDVRSYLGPDVPELVAPENGFETSFFDPELTVYQKNCEYVEFQLDNLPTFSSDILAQWIVECEPENLVASRPPDSSRPPGTYYWRARGIANGRVSAWSDYRILIILPLITNDEFLYLNANIGLAPHDSIEDDRFLYLGANIGIEPHDPIVDDRFYYLNVNVELPTGFVIYPIEDGTRPAKTELPGDDEWVDF